MNIPLTYLQAGGNPDAINRNVDGGDQGCSSPFDVCDLLFVGDQKVYPVDNDLEKKLDLQDCLASILGSEGNERQ